MMVVGWHYGSTKLGTWLNGLLSSIVQWYQSYHLWLASVKFWQLLLDVINFARLGLTVQAHIYRAINLRALIFRRNQVIQINALTTFGWQVFNGRIGRLRGPWWLGGQRITGSCMLESRTVNPKTFVVYWFLCSWMLKFNMYENIFILVSRSHHLLHYRLQVVCWGRWAVSCWSQHGRFNHKFSPYLGGPHLLSKRLSWWRLSPIPRQSTEARVDPEKNQLNKKTTTQRHDAFMQYQNVELLKGKPPRIFIFK